MIDDKAGLYSLDISAVEWRKSPFSGGQGDCVEIADLPEGGVALRDSKRPGMSPFRFTATEWDAFRRGVVAGHL